MLSSITYSLCLALWREAIRPRLPLFQNERQATGYQGKLHQFYMRVFPKWFFLALEEGKIDPITLQPVVEDWNDLVMESDLIYFQRDVREKLKAPVKARIDGVTQNIPPVEVNLRETQGVSFLGVPVPKEVRFDRMPLTPVPIKVTPLTPIQLTRCARLLTSKGVPQDRHQMLIDELQATYSGLGGGSNFLSGPPTLLRGFVEMFGSPFNTVDKYCSPFQFEVDFFDSLGSAFKHTCKSGQEYWVNPPFDETMLANAMKHIDYQLQTVPNLMVMVIIPDWTGKYEAGEYLNWNGYKRSIAKTRKMEHQFYNYSTGGYQPACDCIIAVLSNRDRVEDHVSLFVDKWRELVFVSQRQR